MGEHKFEKAPPLPPGMPSAKELLERYRQMSHPHLKMQIDSFNQMTIGERDELLYYGVLYCTEQLAGILTHIQRISTNIKPN